jgi:dihydroorotase
VTTSYIIPALRDPHQHLREDLELQHTVEAAELWCDTILGMPNTREPLTTLDRAKQYYLGQVRAYTTHLTVMPCLYLTEDTTHEQLKEAADHGINSVKIYPRGKTSHSQHGIRNYTLIYPQLDVMQSLRMTAHFHGEHPESDPWTGERDFYTQIFPAINQAFPRLRMVLEHISTKEAVETVLKGPGFRVATITPQHLLFTIGDLLQDLDSALHCRPALKETPDQRALQSAAISGDPRIMLGSDSAPWKLHKKRPTTARAVIPCGCWTAKYLPIYLATIFEQLGALDKLSTFAHHNATQWWSLRPTSRCLSLVREPTTIPHLTEGDYIPLCAGATLPWSVERHYT